VLFRRYFSQKHREEQVRGAKVDKRKARNHDSDAKSDGAIKPAPCGSSDEDSDPGEAVIWKVGPTGNVRPVWLMESMQAMKASMAKPTVLMTMTMPVTMPTTTTTVSSDILFMI
jgi:hypothetical protein